MEKKDISEADIQNFKKKLETYMEDNEMSYSVQYITREAIVNALNRNRSVADVAWALSQ